MQPSRPPLRRAPLLKKPGVVSAGEGRGVIYLGDHRYLKEVVGEEDTYVHVYLVELPAHLGGGVDHAGALLPRGELRLVGGGPWREAGDVQVELPDVLYVLEGLLPGHLAIGHDRLRGLVDVDVAVYDEYVLEPLLAFPSFRCSFGHGPSVVL
jgi:hypothetical protein